MEEDAGEDLNTLKVNIEEGIWRASGGGAPPFSCFEVSTAGTNGAFNQIAPGMAIVLRPCDVFSSHRGGAAWKYDSGVVRSYYFPNLAWGVAYAETDGKSASGSGPLDDLLRVHTGRPYLAIVDANADAANVLKFVGESRVTSGFYGLTFSGWGLWFMLMTGMAVCVSLFLIVSVFGKVRKQTNEFLQWVTYQQWRRAQGEDVDSELQAKHEKIVGALLRAQAEKKAEEERYKLSMTSSNSMSPTHSQNVSAIAGYDDSVSDWVRVESRSQPGFYFYGNRKTGETRWTHPDEPDTPTARPFAKSMKDYHKKIEPMVTLLELPEESPEVNEEKSREFESPPVRRPTSALKKKTKKKHSLRVSTDLISNSSRRS